NKGGMKMNSCFLSEYSKIRRNELIETARLQQLRAPRKERKRGLKRPVGRYLLGLKLFIPLRIVT
ncbi:hypothetical protein QUF70_12180, partial [Desulfobacterales bacterium HSG17]|nr:hypothetical protein [Desulfobacterales bacterium HSG17]